MTTTAAKKTRGRRPTILLCALLAALAAAALAGPASALGVPALSLSVTHKPLSGVPAGGHASYQIALSNSGDASTSGTTTVDFSVPAGMQILSATDEIDAAYGAPVWDCTIAGGSQSVSCVGPEDVTGGLTGVAGSPFPIGAGSEACTDYVGISCRLTVLVSADPGLAPGTAVVTATASGGGAPSPGNASDPTPVWKPFDLISWQGAALDGLSNPFTTAGGHPGVFRTIFEFPDSLDANGKYAQLAAVKDVHVALPPGLIGNPQTTSASCAEAQLIQTACPVASQVGVIYPQLSGGPPDLSPDNAYALYSMVAPPGVAAQFGFIISNTAWYHITARALPDGKIVVDTDGFSQLVPIIGGAADFWGVPADSSHDALRQTQGCSGCASPDAADPKPFLSLPTNCAGPQPVGLRADSWQDPADFVNGSFDLPANDGCNALTYTGPNAPSLQARPTTSAADSPSGLDVDVHTPQNDDPNGVAEAHLKNATITLPPGLVVNPSSANGLGVCSPAQIGIDAGSGTPNANPVSCPDASKLGTVEVDTPLLDHPAPGSLYLAKPFDNPFDSLVALYLVIDDPQSGTLVKMAGSVTLDPQTGQLSSSFENNPQLPFDHLKVHVFGGAGASLRTPAVCGDYTTASTLTPWSAPDAAAANPTDQWSITQGANGGACSNSEASQPNSPSLDAGTVSPLANNYSPLVVNLTRPDGSQQFSKVTVSPPPGLLGKLAGVPACSETGIAQAQGRTGHGDGATEQADPSCPAASQVGTVDVAAGAGPSPYWAPGKVYMGGPYKGAPLSFVIITPAVAGPFDLGVVVTRVALQIDPATAQITAVSDPIPSILDGIPLDVTQARIRIDRDQFIHTGTSCDPFAFTGSLLSTLGQSAALSSRYQLGECSSLPFKPRVGLRLKGGHFRNGHPAATIVLSERGGDANLGKAQFVLPPTMQLDQSHIQAPCTRPQFAADQCPAASVIGSATATSPYVDYTLSGPVYLRTGDNPLPDVVLDLHGPASQPVRFDVVNKIDTVNARLRSTSATLPDAPVSKAVIHLLGGHKGLLVNNTNLCKQPNRATVFLNGQNGKTADSNPNIAVKCPKAHKRKHHRKHKRHHRRAHHRAALRHLRAVR